MVDLPHGHGVTALPRRYLACLLFPVFPGMFAQTVAHTTGLGGRASAFPAMVPQWLVNYGEISLLVVQLFLINLNIYTESRLLSRAEFVACAHSCVVPGVVAAEPHCCLPATPACPGPACVACLLAQHLCPPSIPACPAWGTAAGSDPRRGNRRAEKWLSQCTVLSMGWVHVFLENIFSHANTCSCPWES